MNRMSESDFAPPRREMTSRHRVDRRPLLSLAVLRDSCGGQCNAPWFATQLRTSASPFRVGMKIMRIRYWKSPFNAAIKNRRDLHIVAAFQLNRREWKISDVRDLFTSY